MSDLKNAFLKDFADLLEKHNVEIEVLLDSGYEGGCLDSLDFDEADGKFSARLAYVNRSNFYSKDIRELIK